MLTEPSTVQGRVCNILVPPQIYPCTDFSRKKLQQLAMTIISVGRRLGLEKDITISPTGFNVLTCAGITLNIFYSCKWNKLEGNQQNICLWCHHRSRGWGKALLWHIGGGSHSCHIDRRVRRTVHWTLWRLRAWGTQVSPSGDSQARADGRLGRCSAIPSV